MKKYSFTGETKVHLGITLHQIKAEISFGAIVAGEIGGWIEKEENLNMSGNAWVSGNAEVYGDAEVCGDARVYGDAEVCGNAWVYGDARVYGDAEVCGNARVSGDAEVCGNARVYGDAEVYWISKIGSRLGTTTFFKSKLGIEVSCGCFLGTIGQFEEAVERTHGDNKHGKAYRLAIEIAKLQIESENSPTGQ